MNQITPQLRQFFTQSMVRWCALGLFGLGFGLAIVREQFRDEPLLIPSEMTVTELKALLDRHPEDYLLVDVRNVEEYQIAQIPEAVLIPLPEIQQGPGAKQVQELLKGRRLIVHCRTGVRSEQALDILKNYGVEGTNVTGGIVAWSREVDPAVPEY